MVVVFARPSNFFSPPDLSNSIRCLSQGMTATGLHLLALQPQVVLWAGSTIEDLRREHGVEGVAELLKKRRPTGKGVGNPDLIVAYFDDKNAWQYQEVRGRLIQKTLPLETEHAAYCSSRFSAMW